MKYSEEEKLKFVRGFRKCTLPVYDYAKKMQIEESDLREWLKEYKGLSAFGAIHINSQVVSTPEVAETKITEEPKIMTTMNITSNIGVPKTILSFENETIKIEIKENYNKELLTSLIGVVAKC